MLTSSAQVRHAEASELLLRRQHLNAGAECRLPLLLRPQAADLMARLALSCLMVSDPAIRKELHVRLQQPSASLLPEAYAVIHSAARLLLRACIMTQGPA